MDPRLWELLEEGNPDDEVEAIVKLRHAEDVPPEIRIVARFGEIATCRLRRGSIVDVRGKVRSLKAPSYLTEEPVVPPSPADAGERGAEEIEPDQRRPDIPETGRGVVVGVVDFGFDFAHPEFVNEDGTTRILYLWDQRGAPPASAANPYGKGTIYSREEINAALASEDPYATLDYDAGSSKLASDHGTHVMAIAAGNGRAGGPVGIAPGADLICVHLSAGDTRGLANFGDSVSLLEAIDFVFTAAEDHPCVVNLSMGLTGGPHDGLTLAEQALDRVVADTPGRCVVQSCGNYFERRTHTAGRLGPGEQRTLHWIVDQADATPDELEIWYSGQDVFGATLVSPRGERFGPVRLGARAERIVLDGEEVGRFYHRAYEPNNLDHHIDIFLDPGAPPGEWLVEVSGEQITNGDFHGWIERDVGRAEDQSRFAAEDVIEQSTTGTIANGFRTIAVGAYDSHFLDRPPAPFSSIGPTRDGRPKPELVAPGVNVLSAGSTLFPDQDATLLIEKSGTSMAAPSVAGTVALIYEAAGRALEADEVKKILLDSVDPPTAPEGESERLGRGYLNSKRAVERARTLAAAGFHVPVEAILSTEAEGHPPAPVELAFPAMEDQDGSPQSPIAGGEIMATEYEPRRAGEAMLDAVEQSLSRNSRQSVLDIVLDHLDETASTAEEYGRTPSSQTQRPSAALLFDTVAYDRGGSTARYIGEHFEVVARPGETVPDDLRAGDIMIQRALGEGRLAQAYIMAESSSETGKWTSFDRSAPFVERSSLRSTPGDGRHLRSRKNKSSRDDTWQDKRLPLSNLILRVVSRDEAQPDLAEKDTDDPTERHPNSRTGAQDLDPSETDATQYSQIAPAGVNGNVKELELGSLGRHDFQAQEVNLEQTIESDDPLENWEIDRTSSVLLQADDKLAILPASRFGVLVPPARMRNVDWQQVIIANDLGPFLGIPPVGAGGSRVFRAGPRLGVMVDAGRHPTRQPAAVYLDHVAARMRDLNVEQIHAVVLIHRHSDHTNEIARIVSEYNIQPSNVIVPRAYVRQQPPESFARTIRALEQHFGSAWRPTYINLRPATPDGELLRGRYRLGDTTLQFFGLASALNNVRRQTDRASLLTRVSRRGEPGAIVVLGDLRGNDLEAFHNAMGAERWREIFRNVTTISGFSHHRGRLEASHVNGIIRLLEATLLRTGRLTVLIQTDPAQHAQARSDTLEFMRRIGIEVRETNVATGRQISGVRASTRGARASGPFAQSHRPITSQLTNALTRINRLSNARQTVSLWGPHIAQSNPEFDTARELRQIDQSLSELRRAVRDAVRAAANVRTSAGRIASGARDYSGGTHGAAYQTALNSIPTTTQAETAIGQRGFEALERLRRIPRREIPLRVALRDALVNGRYSRQAFQYMLSQLDPATRRSIFTGPRGGPSGHLSVFQRVRAEFGFRQALMGGMNMVSTGHLRPRPRMAARGIAGLLLAIEIGNLAGQAVQTYRIARATARNRNIAPFLRRIAFWRQLRAQPAAVAVEDGLFNQHYERDPSAIDRGLREDDWDFLYIEHTEQRPALSDADILQIIAVLGYNIRNYDEYATLFEDSGQDAVRFRTSTTWSEASWEVQVGRFETSGSNQIVERWEELPLLSEGMQEITARIVRNTRILLQRVGSGESVDTVSMGTLQVPRGQLLRQAQLREGISTSEIELRPAPPRVWSGRAAFTPQPIRHEVQWQTRNRPSFYVWEEDSTHVRVTGADFNTYVRLRDLRTERYQVVATRRALNDVERIVVGNETGEGWLTKSDIVDL